VEESLEKRNIRMIKEEVKHKEERGDGSEK